MEYLDVPVKTAKCEVQIKVSSDLELKQPVYSLSNSSLSHWETLTLNLLAAPLLNQDREFPGK